MSIRRTIITIAMISPLIFGATTQLDLTDAFDNQLAAKDYGADYSIMIEGGFSYHDGFVHYWNASTGYSKLDVSTGDITVVGKPENINSNGYGDPFGAYDSENGYFYGATCDAMSDGYLYKYDESTEQWTEEGSAVNFYGGQVYNGELYFSGLNEPWNGSVGQTTFISRFVPDSPHTYNDIEGGLQLHDSLIETAGNSAHMAIDKDGNFYYAVYNSGDLGLYKWTSSQVETVIDDIANDEIDEYLTLEDGEKLTDLPGGANGLTVDDGGHVFVTVNNSSYLMMWNGTSGDGDNYTILGESSAAYGWFGGLAIEGDFTKGDALYGSYNFYGPITAIAIPACVNRPSMDANGDCRVSIDDFATFASQWLTDGLEYKMDME
ncbi:MAG: hypothetical protein ACIAQZ_00110 [Sedimentisphaeraceae bacterium JB056]